MKHYTTTGDCNTQEDLRANWRRNKNYRRKVADRAGKKRFRSRLKRDLAKLINRIQTERTNANS